MAYPFDHGMEPEEVNVLYETVQALLASLTPTRRDAILVITNNLIKLKLSPASMDSIVAAVVLEAAEAQYVEEGGARPPARDLNTSDILKPIIENKKVSKKPDVN